ncbi:MAG: hypothetical protein H7282_04990 [Cytophagaceae bacterium]|nr:hypothetical protein [Cytophagaceae bacterium]
MDVALLETLNGGDIQINGNDLALQNSWGNMIYIALFGGNKEADTKSIPDNEMDNSWWGNDLLMPNDPAIQFNSKTERILDSVALNSNGRIQIENTVKEDLAFLTIYFIIAVSVTIISTDRIKIEIQVRALDSLPSQYATAIIIWDVKTKSFGDFNFTDFNDQDFFI